MARIAHLSDVHFGAHDDKVVAGAEAWLQEQQPDLVIISGDFTQRARVEQFSEAGGLARPASRRRAGRCSPCPAITTSRSTTSSSRFAAPLHRYSAISTTISAPGSRMSDVAVLGINTARSLTFKDGRINREQMGIIEERFAAVPADKTRILVTHHPLFAMPIGEGTRADRGGRPARGRGRRRCAAPASTSLLAGHFHRTYAEAARKMVEKAGRALVIQAGTATSTRLRNDELQSFNWIHAHRNNDIELQVIAWDGSGFRRGSHVRFGYDGENWSSRTISPRHARGGGGRAARPARPSRPARGRRRRHGRRLRPTD